MSSVKVHAELSEQMEADVLHYMQGNQGMQYTSAQIARHLDKFPLAVKSTLTRLVDKGSIQLSIERGITKYIAMPVLDEQRKLRIEKEPHFRPLSPTYMAGMIWAMTKRAV